MINGLDKLDVVTLFVEDVPSSKAFYQAVFGLDIVYEDDVSAVFKLRNVMINLLQLGQAPELVRPSPVGASDSGVRFMLTIEVDDADLISARLELHGVTLLNGPMDRPWGRRTAAFADPAGNVWEIAQVLPRAS
jgi:catechol 2,3-dioxygenase-like lactoylglutathione lyase family enzyme